MNERNEEQAKETLPVDRQLRRRQANIKSHQKTHALATRRDHMALKLLFSFFFRFFLQHFIAMYNTKHIHT